MSQRCLFSRDCGKDTTLGLHQILVSPRLRVGLPLSRGPLDLTAFDQQGINTLLVLGVGSPSITV
jgi:hypothetical protein